VAAEHGHLLLSESGSAGGNHVLDAAEKDGDAVHLALNEEGELMLTDGGAGLVEIEEDVSLGVERRLRGVDVLGAGFIASFEGAGGEGDDAAALVGDGKHDALAEAVVDGAKLRLPSVAAATSLELKRPLARRVSSSPCLLGGRVARRSCRGIGQS